MGCNFYFGENERTHIGKRSAAGAYCWDCKITLCRGGQNHIHSGLADWDDVCPKCKKEKVKEGMDNSAAGRELGFNKSPFAEKQGVKSCSSFTWAIDPNELGKEITGNVYDEYGREYTHDEFFDVLKECPVQFLDSIGIEFS
jgi:Zn-finger protein